MESGADMSVSKWLGRNRVSAFFFAFALVALLNTITEENDIFLHVVDDYADIAIIVVALALLAMWWKKKSPAELKRTQNVMAVLAVALILATIFAITQEINDPADFGNEIPSLLFGVFLLINRFV
jgi:heme A synthase